MFGPEGKSSVIMTAQVAPSNRFDLHSPRPEEPDRHARDAVECPGEHPLPTPIVNQHGTSDVVAGPAGGDLDAWAKRFTTPRQIVDVLAREIHYQGAGPNEARKKLWMFMRWVVRPALR